MNVYEEANWWRRTGAFAQRRFVARCVVCSLAAWKHEKKEFINLHHKVRPTKKTNLLTYYYSSSFVWHRDVGTRSMDWVKQLAMARTESVGNREKRESFGRAGRAAQKARALHICTHKCKTYA